MTVKAESGKGSAAGWGNEDAAQPSPGEAAQSRPARCLVTGAQGGCGACKPRTVQRARTPECTHSAHKTLHDKEDGAENLQVQPAGPTIVGRVLQIWRHAVFWPVIRLAQGGGVRRHVSDMAGGGRGRRATVAAAAGQADRNHRTMRAMRA